VLLHIDGISVSGVTAVPTNGSNVVIIVVCGTSTAGIDLTHTEGINEIPGSVIVFVHTDGNSCAISKMGGSDGSSISGRVLV